jgi:hypothetical protein
VRPGPGPWPGPWKGGGAGQGGSSEGCPRVEAPRNPKWAAKIIEGQSLGGRIVAVAHHVVLRLTQSLRLSISRRFTDVVKARPANCIIPGISAPAPLA